MMDTPLCRFSGCMQLQGRPVWHKLVRFDVCTMHGERIEQVASYVFCPNCGTQHTGSIDREGKYVCAVCEMKVRIG